MVMLKLSTTLYNVPIFSLRTGLQIGTATKPLINPQNLKIEAWFAESKFDTGLLLLPTSEIREVSRQGIAVNDQTAITPAEDLVRMAQLIQLDFQLLSKKVFSEDKLPLGKVADYATDLESFYIQRLFINPGAIRQLTTKQRIISRVQITEITNKKIVVKDTEVTVSSPFFFRPRPAPAPEA